MMMTRTLLPQMVALPGGLSGQNMIEPFSLGLQTVTNAQYWAHVDHYRCYEGKPYVQMITIGDSVSLNYLPDLEAVQREFGSSRRDRIPSSWDTRDPLVFPVHKTWFPDYPNASYEGAIVFFELRTDLSPKGYFSHPDMPVANTSWFHALEYCVSNGFRLPSENEWSYAAGITFEKKPSERTERDADFGIMEEWTSGRDPSGFVLCNYSFVHDHVTGLPEFGVFRRVERPSHRSNETSFRVAARYPERKPGTRSKGVAT